MCIAGHDFYFKLKINHQCIPLALTQQMKNCQCFDIMICITTVLVKITTLMNHQSEMQTDTWIKIVQIKCYLIQYLLNHPFIWPLHYHSVDTSWIFPFSVSSLVEISSLKFSKHKNSLQNIPVKGKSILQLYTICCFNLPVPILVFYPVILT